MTDRSSSDNGEVSRNADFISVIPSEKLYWAHVADSITFHHGRLSSQAERVLPVDVDSLHQCWIKVPQRGGWLMAGIQPERLRQFLLQHPDISPKVWALVPSQIPPHLPALPAAACASLNFLWGEFEPESSRRLRIATLFAATIGMILVVISAVFGIERHRSAWLAIATSVNQRSEARLATAVTGDAAIPADQRLTMALRRAEAAAGLVGSQQLDVATILQTLLASLPRDMRVQTESLSVGAERVTWRARVTDLAQAERLHQACDSLSDAGFRLQPLQAQQSDGCATVVIDLLPQLTQP